MKLQPFSRSPVERALARLARVDVRLTLALVALPTADRSVAERLARALDVAGIITAAVDTNAVLLLYVGPRSVMEGDDAVTAELAIRSEAALVGLGAATGVAPRFAATHFWSAEVGDLEAALTRLRAEEAFSLRVQTVPPQAAEARISALAS